MRQTAFDGTPTDPLARAIEHYRTVESYCATIHSNHTDGDEHIRYWYKNPGFVRIEFIQPHAGAVLIYNPYTKNVRLWPFGIKHFPELNMSPDNPQVQSSRGQRVDKSDVGILYDNVLSLRELGGAETLGEESIDGRTVLHLMVTGSDDVAIAGVHRFELWLDRTNQFPAKVVSRNRQNAIIETVVMEDLNINASLPMSWFNP